VAVDAVIGYLHRCHEKLAETLTYTQYPPSPPRRLRGRHDERARLCPAAEMIGKIDVPKRAQYLRVIAAELQRIASHCCGSARGVSHGGRWGAGPRCFSTASRARGRARPLRGADGGATLVRSAPGGRCRYDIPADWAGSAAPPWTRSKAHL